MLAVPSPAVAARSLCCVRYAVCREINQGSIAAFASDPTFGAGEDGRRVQPESSAGGG